MSASPISSRRIHSLDLLRGGGILVILIIHRLHYHWAGLSGKEAVRAELAGPLKPLVILTIALFTMAGVFYFVTGFVNAYSVTNRIRAGASRAVAMRGAIVAGLWLIGLNYVYRVFLSNGFQTGVGGEAPRFPAGILAGWIRYGQAPPFRWSQVTEPGTLALIGWILIIVTLLLVWRLPKRQEAPGSLEVGPNLGVLAVCAVLISPALKFFLRPAYESALASGRILRATALGLLSDEFGLFPYLAFGLVGAVLGVAVSRGGALPAIRKRASLGSLGLFAVAIAALLASDRHSEFGRRVMGVAVSAAELSLFVVFWVVLSKIFDDADSSRRHNWFIRGIARFGAVALTVYMLEGILAETLARLLNVGFGQAWSKSYFLVFAFGILCAAVWWAALIVWEKGKFCASLEWVSVKLLRTLGKKESGKLRNNLATETTENTEVASLP